ncbi:MAG: helix-hairpin-helix domain-containing protein [Dissulfuribacterales bacterium]
MIESEVHRAQLQSILLLAVLFLCLWLFHWFYDFLSTEKQHIHIVSDTNNCIVNRYAMLYFESVNVNSATLEELDLLPGVGFKTANAILNLRQEYGFFLLNEELKDAMAGLHLPRRHMNALVGGYLIVGSSR